MDHLSPNDGAALGSTLSLIRGGNERGGLPWLSSMMPGSSGEQGAMSSGPQRRDLARERAEHRALMGPVPPRNARGRGSVISQKPPSKSRVNLNDSSSGSTPKDPNSPERALSEAEAPTALPHDRQLPLASARWSNDEWSDRLQKKKTAMQRVADSDLGEGQGVLTDFGSPLNLSKCVSLLDEHDLAGLAAAEAEYAKAERARQLMQEVQEAAMRPPSPSEAAEPEPARAEAAELQPSLPSPVPLSEPETSPSPFFGVELSLD